MQESMKHQMKRQKSGTRLADKTKELYWPVFDTLTYTSGTTTKLEFFKEVKADLTKSNMDDGGMFPVPQNFLVQAIRVVPLVLPQSVATTTQTTALKNLWLDMHKLIYNSYLRFTVERTEFLTAPTHLFASGSGITGFGFGMLFGVTTAQKDSIAYANHGSPDPRAINVLPNTFWLESQQKFVVELIWQSAQTLDVGNTEIQIVLEGKRELSVQ